MNSRLAILALALVAASAFALSVIGGAWWTIGDVATIGPFGSRRCFAGDCRVTDLNWIGGDVRWVRIGMATWAAGLIAMLSLLAIAAAAASRRFPALLGKLGISASLTATAAGIAFVAMFPALEGAAIGRGVWLFAFACVLGTFTAIQMVRAARAKRAES